MPDALSAAQRIAELQTIMAKFPTHKLVDVGNFESGPYNNRKMTKASYVEFPSKNLRNDFLKAIGGECATASGGKL
eukprot:6968137-Pyramimonas_sp.AAC.1